MIRYSLTLKLKILSNLLKRSITGSLIVATIIGCIIFNPFSFYILFALISILGLNEFYNLSKKNNANPQKIIGIITGFVLFSSNFLYASGNIEAKIFLINIPFIVLIFINELYRKKEQPFINIAYTFLGILYIALPFSLCNYLVLQPSNEVIYTPHILLGLFILLWTSDSGAYVVGSQIGKRRLFPRISPKKSWEGSIGGAVFALIAAWIMSLYFKELILTDWLIIAIITVVSGTYGDLSESLFKRSIDVKDSGNILPGHGGILDRFDSVLLAAPLVFTYVQLSNF